MRAVISDFLAERAKIDANFYVLSGDHGYALFDKIRNLKPEQFINVGVSEQAMVGYAAGMTKQGMSTIIYGLAAFVPLRVLEFIKMDICYENLPVVILGDGAGIVYTTLGASHQCAEDIACMRSIPNMHVFSPCDAIEMSACLKKAVLLRAPAYIRIGKSDKASIHKAEINLEQDAFIQVRYSSKKKYAIVATGSMVSTAYEIANILDFCVYSSPELTQRNPEAVMKQLQSYETLFSLEEHHITGGLGSLIAEIISSYATSGKRLLRYGIKNRFTKKCGSYEYAMEEHGLDLKTLLVEFKNRIGPSKV